MDNEGRCTTVDVFVPLLEDVDVADLARMKWSSCLRRHAEEQNAVPFVWRSQDRQKSPRTGSMWDDFC